jgi:HlyD family secretion protein
MQNELMFRKHICLVYLCLLLILSVMGMACSSKTPSSVVTGDTPLQQPLKVVGLGRILPLSGVVTVAAPYGAADARVAKILVKEGDTVKEGDVLAVLDNEKMLIAALEIAKAQVFAKGAVTKQVVNSVQASREEIKAQIARVQVSLLETENDLVSQETLLKTGSVSAQTVDAQRSRRDELLREKERLLASQTRYGEGNVYAQSDAQVATKNMSVAKADLMRAQADLEKAYVRAPIDGTVLKIHVDAGEKPGAQGILNLGQITTMKVEVEVYQTNIMRVYEKQHVIVKTPVLDKELHGQVQFIGLEVGRQQAMEQSPAAHTDARVILVTVVLDAESSKRARGLTNLQVDAEFSMEKLP